MARNIVVLPAPLAPTRETTSLAPTERLTPARTMTSPYPAARSETSSIERLCPEIGLDNLVVADNRRRASFGNLAAEIEDDHARCSRHQCFEHVLDHHHCNSGSGDPAEQLHEFM